MTPEERAELDRLLDLREREELMARVPTPEQDERRSQQIEAERVQLASVVEVRQAAERARREQLAPDAEWIGE